MKKLIFTLLASSLVVSVAQAQYLSCNAERMTQEIISHVQENLNGIGAELIEEIEEPSLAVIVKYTKDFEGRLSECTAKLLLEDRECLVLDATDVNCH